MKILHVLDCSIPNISGYSLRSKYILDSQKKLGLDILAVTSPKYESSADIETIDGIFYHRTAIKNHFLKNISKNNVIIKSKLFTKALYKKIEETVRNYKNIDIIHAHSPILCGLPALAVAKKYKIPIVYEVRALWEDAAVDQGKTKVKSLRYRLTRYHETKLLNRVTAVTTICQGLKEEMVSRSISQDKIFVTPNGIDTERFSPQNKDGELVDEFELNGNVVFGFIGSFFEFEGLEIFLEAVTKLIAQNKQIKVLIVGGGRREQELRAFAAKLNNNGQIIFTGRVPHDMIKRYYSVMDILVYPRLKNRLTELVTPLKPLEAMSMEKTVIASNAGGLQELIEDEKTGVLFKAGSVDDLIEKITYLLNNPKIRVILGKQAREHVIRNRDWLDISKQYLKIYTRLVTN